MIVGGGAAGMMAAVTAAERGMRVLLVEPNRQLGRKVRISGKGRCNLTNDCDVRGVLANVPTNPKFLYSALTAFPPEKVMAFFEDLGVPLKTERGGRVFPVSDSAHDVADALAARMQALGVEHVHGRAVRIVTGPEGAVTGVETERGVIDCRWAVLSTGGVSYPATGSTGDGYAMAAALGHKIVSPRGSLVPLESDAPYCAALAGLSPRNVDLTLLEDGKALWKQRGEMLFAHFGVTGPLVLSASAHIRRWDERRYALAIDFKPALDEEKLDGRIRRDLEKYANRDMANALAELAPRVLIPVLLELADILPEEKAHDLTREQRRALGRMLKAFPVPLTGPRPVAEAIVTAGGVDVKEVDPRTMMSKLVPGLFFAGEILDVDAYTGGFNLQIAWATGRMAGMAAGGGST